MTSRQIINHLISLNVQDTLLDTNGLEMLQTFLKNHTTGDRSSTELYIEIFLKCNELQKQSGAITLEQFEDLADMGLPRNIEIGKRDMIRKGDGKKCALLIREQLCKLIEMQKDYNEFRKYLVKL